LAGRAGGWGWAWVAEKERLESELQTLRGRISQLSEHLERAQREARGQMHISQELESRLAAAQTQLASATGERERLARELADIKRSRLLRLGRSLRRLRGLPVPY